MIQTLTIIAFFLLAQLSGLRAEASTDAAGFSLRALWNQAGSQQELGKWNWQDLSRLKQISSREKDPVTGKVFQWKGVSLSHLIENALASLSAERRAQIDLILLRNAQGKVAFVPRAFTVKYPVILAMSRDQEDLSRSGLVSVVPWTSKTKTLQEGLPLESFFVPGVTQIEFTNYRERYNSVFLVRRTDPAALRGEKLFVQNCLSCHGVGQGPSLEQISHRSIASVSDFENLGGGRAFHQKLNEKDWRSLKSYLDAHRTEHPETAQAR